MLFWDQILFALWLLAIVGLLAALIVTFVRSHRRTTEKRYFSSDEVHGALVARNGALRGKVFPISRQGLVLGRDPALADVVVDDNRGVSRQHTRVFVAGGRVIVLDMHSKNGTYVDERRVHQHELAHGDVFTLGKGQPTIFVYLRKPA